MQVNQIKVEEISLNDISRIIEALRLSQGVDFSNYAFSSFRRRVIRFTEINRVRNIDTMIDRISSDKSYSENIIDGLTVNVTEMFRDPTFWIMLRDSVLPALAGNETINIWHAACSTGEEVFSMVILLHEASLLNKSRIIATDLNKNVLRTAGSGLIRHNNLGVNTRNYDHFKGKGNLADYYTANGNTVYLDKNLLSNVEFRKHDLTREEPPALFDLVLCRNVLIYFNSELQERVFTTINKGMNKGSFIAIGSKESIRWCREYHCFHEESIEEKIYKKITDRKVSVK